MPEWLVYLAIISLVLGIASAFLIAIDLVRGHRQQMWIMNLVWPITALYSGPIGLWFYFYVGRLSSQQSVQNAERQGKENPGKMKPFYQTVGLAATHCGSGCTVGDILVETILIVVPLTLFGKPIFAAWVIDYIAAFAFGIAFQYFTIQPMRHLPPREGLIAALKADALSLTAWQIGMYGWMGIVTFGIFDHELPKTGPVFWFMMQIAMLAGFATSYPINWWLVKAGIKEKM
ncbi:MAG: DUF4396 domain-containing protein [Pseudomonadota bacterium]